MDFRRTFFILTIVVLGAYTQPNEPRAVVNGKTVSLSYLEPLYGSIPPQMRNNPEFIFRTYGFLDRMAAKGEASKLYEQSPYKEKLELDRKQILAQAVTDQFFNNLDIPDAELKEYFDKHPGDFDTASVQSLLIPTSSKEEEAAATAKAKQIAPQLKDGTNLAMLFAQYPAGLTAIHRNDPAVDAAIRTAVFALKPGQVSEPIVRPNGVYLIRLDSTASVDFQKAKPDVRKTIADSRFQAFIEEVRKSVTVTPVKAPGGN